MKDYRRIIFEADPARTVFLTHEWGQSAEALFNRVAEAWNVMPVGNVVLVTTYKKFGSKAIVQLCRAQGLPCEVVGKGPDELRLLACAKDAEGTVELLSTSRPAAFSLGGKEFIADTGEAVFSKGKLDPGTRMLLERFLEETGNPEGKRIADFGTGWGAIALVAGTFLPGARITAFEREYGSLRAAEKNLAGLPNVLLVEADFTDSDAMRAEYRNAFDVILANPPFHAKNEEREGFFRSVRSALARNGKLWMVTERNFTGRFRRSGEELLALIDEEKEEEYDLTRWNRPLKADKEDLLH